jgi:glc operon protein GlcG
MEESMKAHTSLDHTDALVAIERIRGELERRGKGAVIAVADDHGELLGVLRVGAVQVTSITIASNKAYTAARERKPSREIGESSRRPESPFDIAYFGDARIVGWGGGLPVVVDGVVVGAVGVSGLPESEDVELATMGVAAILEAS